MGCRWSPPGSVRCCRCSDEQRSVWTQEWTVSPIQSATPQLDEVFSSVTDSYHLPNVVPQVSGVVLYIDPRTDGYTMKLTSGAVVTLFRLLA